MEEANFSAASLETFCAQREEMLALLQSSLRCPSVSGKEQEFVQWLAKWGAEQGFEVDQWIGDEAELDKQFGPLPRHLPLANRPTLHIRLKGSEKRPTLLFNGHTDVVDVSKRASWQHDPWGGEIEGSIVYGRGACDVKGPIVAALWAMLALQTIPAEQRGDVAIELVPGEEDCVGLGTLTSVARGYRADGVVVLEPTEGHPRCASRGGCRFEIVVSGRAVHGTVKWLGIDAIGLMQKVLSALARIEERWNDKAADPLFSRYPIARPITVDHIEGGKWQGMICDSCVCGGYLELLPKDDLSEWKIALKTELSHELRCLGEDPDCVAFNFGEEYSGHRLLPENLLCAAAVKCMTQAPGENSADTSEGWRGFNSGCEAGVRAKVFGTPTLVWGPGSLEHAHAVNERIDFNDIELTAERFVRFALNWGQAKDGSV